MKTNELNHALDMLFICGTYWTFNDDEAEFLKNYLDDNKMGHKYVFEFSTHKFTDR